MTVITSLSLIMRVRTGPMVPIRRPKLMPSSNVSPNAVTIAPPTAGAANGMIPVRKGASRTRMDTFEFERSWLFMETSTFAYLDSYSCVTHCTSVLLMKCPGSHFDIPIEQKVFASFGISPISAARMKLMPLTRMMSPPRVATIGGSTKVTKILE